MSKSIYSYKKEYEQFRLNSIIALSLSAGCGLSLNINSMIWTLFTGLTQAYVSYSAYKNSKNAYEYKLLNDIYKSVREELVKNIKTLEQGDIAGIFAYFCHILRNNYLSYNRQSTQYHVEGIFREEPILAAQVLNGHGVCRNIAPALTDIYGDFNIDSSNVLCDHFEVNNHIELNAEDFLTEEDLANIEKQETLEDTINELNTIFERVAIKLFEDGIIGPDRRQRHCINLVNDDEHSYLLDAATYQFYTDKDEEGKYYSNMGNYFKVIKEFGYKNPFKKTTSLKLEIPHPIISEEEFANELNNRTKIFKENKDVIEQMHKDIEPLLAEADEVYKLILLAK